METQALAQLTGVKLQQAPVTDTEGTRMRVLTDDGEVWADNALALPFTPRRGDFVLVVGQAERWFVIGVLQAQGDMTFSFPGNVTFSTPRGEVKLKATKGIELHSPNVRLRAGKLELLARSILERADSAKRWITGLWQERAGRRRSDVDEESHTHAGRFVVKARQDVKIDGDKVYLG